MSHAALQRVVVRMLYDAPFVAAVYADPSAAAGAPLATEDLTEAERAWLVSPDRRAYLADPLRRSRSLHALIEEFPVSAALALAAGAPITALDAFFSAAAFHTAIQRRRSLAAAFAEWLAARFGPPVAPVAQLEGAIAAARRGHAAPIPPGSLGLAPRVRALALPEGTTALIQHVTEQLGGGDVLARLLAPTFTLRALPALGAAREALLIEASAEGAVSLEGASDELVALLAAANPPCPRQSLLALARELGCEPGEDAEIIDGLTADGLLVTA